MKNIFYILLLLPTIIFAQYPSNSGQKITLGEQTTADGLVYRGVANDTNVITPFSDTSAYIILDTSDSKFYHYNRTTTYWSLAGGGVSVSSFSAGTTGLTPSTATTGSVTLGGTLSVENGGTGSATKNFLDLTTNQTAMGIKTFPNKIIVGGSTGVSLLANPAANGFGGFWHNSVTPGETNYAMQTNGSTVLVNGSTAVTLAQGGSGKISARSYGADVVGSFGININPPTEKLHVVGNARITGNIGAGIDVAQARLHVKGSASASEFALKVEDSGSNNLLSVQNNGDVTLKNPLSVANGGTGTGTAFTQGSVVFAGASGTYTQDNSNLFWNNSTKRLGLGINTPSETFHASGGAPAFRFSSTIYGDGDTYIGNTGQYGTYIGDGRSIGGTYTGQAATIHRQAVVFSFGGSGTESFVVANYPSKFLTYRLVLDTTGKFAIGLRYPTQKLHVEGNARITAMNGIGDIGADANGVLQAAVSDMNLKNTIENSPFGLNEILLLKPVTFLYNDENRKIDSDVKEVGFIAQDVFDVIPNAVSSTGTGDLQLDYRAITATLVKAIQEQQALIKALEQRILNLENK